MAVPRRPLSCLLPLRQSKACLDAQNELSLLTAITEILDSTDDETLSPFDTMMDAELLTSPRERDNPSVSPPRNLWQEPCGGFLGVRLRGQPGGEVGNARGALPHPLSPSLSFRSFSACPGRPWSARALPRSTPRGCGPRAAAAACLYPGR